MPRLHRGLVAAPVLLTLAAAALLPSSRVAVVAQSQASPPKLLVILVMDQFWAGYLDLYRTQWTRGLRRIVDDGAVFTNAHYTYGLTLTCAGHATIGTGTAPNVHGMVSNSWYDQALKKTVNCVDDPDAVSLPFGGAEGREHHSAKNLLIPTFADELRRQTATTHPARTVSVALKPRSAIMLGGRPGPNAVVVWEEDHGAWATSKHYTNEPWPDVEAFVRTRPMAADYGAIWSLFLPPTSYRFSDEAEGEARPTPWGRTFPHTLHSLTGRPDIGFVSAWERSPWSDAFVADLAAHLVYTRKLGTGRGTDLLTVSLPSLDLVAHEYGPHSFEAQDVLARADQAIGRLLESIERNVGPDGYVLAFSSDHGVATLSERLVAEKKDAGRISSTDYGAAIRTALNKVLGEGTYVGLIESGQVMLMDGVLEKLRAAPNGVETLKQAMGSVKGIARVYGPDDLASSTPTTDPCLQAWRLSYLPGRTGAFVGVARNDWMFKSTGTTHGTCNEKDRHVPVIFYGANVRKGRYSQPVSPADIVPTFAGLTGTEMQHLGGRSLVNDIFRTNDLRGGRRDQPSSSPKR